MSDRLMLTLILIVLSVLGTAVLTAAGAGYLARRDGASYPAMVTRAAAAFAAVLGVSAAVIAAVAAVADEVQ